MTLAADDFYSAASHVVNMLEPRGLKDKIYSDVIDAAGNPIRRLGDGGWRGSRHSESTLCLHS